MGASITVLNIGMRGIEIVTPLHMCILVANHLVRYNIYVAMPQLNAIFVVQKCVLISVTAQQHFDLSTPAICTPNLFHFVSFSPSVTVIDASMIKQKCLFMDFGSSTKYIVTVPSTMQD